MVRTPDGVAHVSGMCGIKISAPLFRLCHISLKLLTIVLQAMKSISIIFLMADQLVIYKHTLDQT